MGRCTFGDRISAYLHIQVVARNAVAEVDGVIDCDLVYAMSNLPVVGTAPKMKAV